MPICVENINRTDVAWWGECTERFQFLIILPTLETFVLIARVSVECKQDSQMGGSVSHLVSQKSWKIAKWVICFCDFWATCFDSWQHVHGLGQQIGCVMVFGRQCVT